MTHPWLFEDDDPLLGRVRDIALAMPGAREKVSHGRPAFYTEKVFTYYGGSVKVDGTWVQHPRAIMVKPDADDRAALLGEARCWVPGYLGPSGWIGIDIAEDTDVEELAELIDSSYRLTAPRSLVGELNDRWSS